MSDNFKSARKQGWLEQCKYIHNFHVEQLRIDKDWTYRDTARELGRSTGTTAQAIKVARWYKTHSTKIETFHDMKSALEWIREVEKERKTEMI